MFRKVLILAAIVLVFAASNLQAVEIINSNWVGGESGFWGDPCNWNPPIVPDNNDSQKFFVTIDSNYAGVDEIEVGLRQSRDVNQVDCYGEICLGNWTSGWVELTIYNGLTNHGYLEIDEIEINGNATNTAGAMLELCDSDIDGDLHNLATATIEAESENDVDGNLQNDGTLTIIHASDLLVGESISNTGLINVYDGECGVDEIFDNNSTGVIRGFGVLYTEQLFRNKGRIYAYGGSLAVASEGELVNEGVLGNYPLSSLHIKPSEDVNNNGTIEVNAGGGVAFDCNLVNVADANINLLGGILAAQTITQSAGATFEGFGGITGNVIIEPNSITEPNSIIKLTGPTNIVGNVTIDPNATLEISDGQTLITGHTICKGTIHLIGGTVIFQGGCDCDDCNIINEAGIDRNHFDINSNGIVNFEDFASFANTWLWKASWY